MSSNDFFMEVICKYLNINFGIRKIEINNNTDKIAKNTPKVFFKLDLILFILMNDIF